MYWKLFALVMIALWLGGTWIMFAGESVGMTEFISLPFSALGAAGLFLYAFQLPSGAPRFWPFFSTAFAIWVVWGLFEMVFQGKADGNPWYTAFIAVLLWGSVSYFTWLALRRLSQAA